MDARHFTVKGRVQGVGFRWFTISRAKSLGLVGWVKNLSDGSVEAWAEGSMTDLDAFESLLKEGPPGAIVKAVSSRDSVPAGRYLSFDVAW